MPYFHQLKVGHADVNAGRVSALTAPTCTINYAYSDSTGQLSTISGPYGETVALGYQGDLVTDETFSGVISGSVHLTYDNQMQVATEDLNGAGSLIFTYDTDGLLTSAGILSVARSGPTGLIAGTRLGTVDDTYTYNGFGEPIGYSAGSTLLQESYTRDALGRISGKTETVQGTAHVYAYAYDARGRLTDVTMDGASASHHEYDANGNRVVFTTSSGTVNATFDAQDRMLTHGSTTYTYGANGELATKTDAGQTTTYTYDALGALTKVVLPGGRTIEYVYDGLLRRVGKKVDGQLVQGFLYLDQLRPVAELDGAGNVISRFIYGTRANVPDYLIRGGVTYRIISDHLGSVRLVVNATNGDVLQRLDYDAWGKVLSDSATAVQPFGFAGGLHDVDTSLVHSGARDYDPSAGRWTAKDPIGFDGGDTNIYDYSGNDPVNGFDPSGLYSYVYSWRIARVGPGVSAWSVMSALQNNPNRYFPFGVVGRWDSIQKDERYNLTDVRYPGDMGPNGNGNWVKVTDVQRCSFTFTSEDQHISGNGGSIQFQTYEADGQVYLKHIGNAPNAPPGENIYAPIGAYIKWSWQAASLARDFDRR